MTAMRDLVVLAALAVWLSACGGSAASRGTASGGAGATSPAAGAPADGPSCDAAATHIVQVIAAERGGRFVEEAPAMTEVVRTRCTADGWSAEARRCLVAATARDAARDCVEKLTPEQQDALQRGEQEMRARSRPDDGDGDDEGAPVDMDGDPDTGGEPPEAPARTMAPPAPMPEKEQAEKKKKKSRSAPKGDRGRSDPCEGGE